MTKSILITGAGAGIGRDTARAFHAAGWRVALMGRREAHLRDTATGDDVLILPADVGDPAAVEAAFARLTATWGRLDVLFNNAGIAAKPAPIDEIPVADWLAVMHTNISGMVLCARAAFHLMRHQTPQGGRIICKAAAQSGSAENAKNPFEGAAIGFAWVDEEIPSPVGYQSILARTTDQDGAVFNSMTALSGWIRESTLFLPLRVAIH